MSNSLRPHGLQHARLPCPSSTPGAYSSSCPLSPWWHPTILSSVITFSSCLQSFPASESFQMSWFFTSGGPSIIEILWHSPVMTNLDSILKSRDITLPTKVHLVKAMVFPVVMYGCASWLWRKLSAEEQMLLNCGVGEDSWESLGQQGDPTSPSWVFIGWTDAEAESPMLWSPDAKNWLIEKDPDAGKDWRWEEKGMTEDEMVGVGDRRGSLVCCSPYGCKDWDTTKWLNWTELKHNK